ncbi:hypothetical protein ACFXD5_12150 [Streptomyces sp. NPDC059385]|uniref:hypothetical protein n=1 Tax=Streptomyces sp. NPDC059385 TaxID=3346817 RepID=UPI00367C7B49
MSNTPTIPAETARHVLAVFGHGGVRPGRFGEQLISLIAGADLQNMARLADAFPAETEAVRMAQYDNDGIAKLQAIAAGRAAA